jgi:hypothetical protein
LPHRQTRAGAKPRIPSAGARGMSLILIKCPETGRAVSTGIEIDRESFRNLPNIGAKTRCPACAEIHVWAKQEA